MDLAGEVICTWSLKGVLASTAGAVATKVIVSIAPTAIAAPWNARWPLAIWNVLGAGTPFRADPDHDDLWNRGAYLVNGPGHCGTCHTPKTWLGGDKAGQALTGAALQGAE